MSYANARNSKQPAYAKAAEKSVQKSKYWNDITGQVRVFQSKGKNGTVYFSTSIRNKTPDGGTHRMFVSVRLPEDLVAEMQGYDSATIDIKRGFLSFDEYEKGGNPAQRLVIVVQEGTILDAE